ncbi:hypothetical protein CYMTET_24684, partial [Cymbomonas tetramitiformis]
LITATDSDSTSAGLSQTELALVIICCIAVVALFSALLVERFVMNRHGIIDEKPEAQAKRVERERATTTTVRDVSRYSNVIIEGSAMSSVSSPDRDEWPWGFTFQDRDEWIMGRGTRQEGDVEMAIHNPLFVDEDAQEPVRRFSAREQDAAQILNPLIHGPSLDPVPEPEQTLLATNPAFDEDDTDVFASADRIDRLNPTFDMEDGASSVEEDGMTPAPSTGLEAIETSEGAPQPGSEGPREPEPEAGLSLSEEDLAELANCDGPTLFQMIFQDLDSEVQALVQRIDELSQEIQMVLLNLIQLMDAEITKMWEMAEKIRPGDTEGLEAFTAHTPAVFDLLQRVQHLFEGASAEEALRPMDATSANVLQSPELMDPEGTKEKSHILLEHMKMSLHSVDVKSAGPSLNRDVSISTDVSEELRMKLLAQRYRQRDSSTNLSSHSSEIPSCEIVRQ